MKKLIFLVMIAVPSLHIHAQFSGGMGTESSPYQITTADQLFDVRGDLTAHYILMNDIDLSSWIAEEDPRQGWTPIGTLMAPFKGVFDGNNKVIKGLYINRPNVDEVGLFGTISNGIIKNVVLVNARVTGHNAVGGIVGRSCLGVSHPSSKIISNIIIGGCVNGNTNVGGILGCALFVENLPTTYANDKFSLIAGNYAAVNVSGYSSCGGICGCVNGSWSVWDSYIHKVTITDNMFFGRLYGSEKCGGIVGCADRSHTYAPYGNGVSCYYSITNNISSGSVYGEKYTGGIVGMCEGLDYYYKEVVAREIRNNVCALDTLSSQNTPVYRICNSEWADNYACSNTIIMYRGNEVQVDDDNFQGTSYGLRSLKRLSTYEGMGFAINDYWDILEGTTFPYAKAMAPPLATVNSFEANTRCSLSGTASEDGFVNVIINDQLYETQVIDGNWSVTLGAIAQGTEALVFFRKAEKAPSMPKRVFAEGINGVEMSSCRCNIEKRVYEWQNIRIIHLMKDGKIFNKRKEIIR